MEKNSAFNKIMTFIDEKLLLDQIRKQGSDRWSKKFSTRDHLAAMLFAQFMGSKSLRELEIQFSSLTQAEYTQVKRSTLSDANKNRSYKIFETICRNMMNDESKELTELLRILDSTPLKVVGQGSKWCDRHKVHRLRGLKIHIQYAPERELFCEVAITHPNVNDISVGRKWEIEPNITYVFDKGYNDYNWWYKIHKQNAFFVTRVKKNTSYKIIKNLPIEPAHVGVKRDNIIQLKNKFPRGNKVNLLSEIPLRLITFHDFFHNKTYTFISNSLTMSAQDIADCYKKRWEVELLFKWVKQNLKIKQLFGRSQNAIKIQIYTALIAYLLLFSLKNASKKFLRVIDVISWVRVTIFSPLFMSMFTSKSTSGSFP